MTTYLSMKECAEMALACQDACNLSGVAHTLAKIMPSILHEMRERHEDTAWANAHPIVYLFLNKMLDLNSPERSALLPYAYPYAKVQQLARGEDAY